MPAQLKNRFGEGTIHDAADLEGRAYFHCAACMSLFAEAASWANAHPGRICTDPAFAHDVVVVSCQVTDLAILNDLRHLEALMAAHPGRRFFVGGCLAYRFDVPLPDGCLRIRHVREDYAPIEARSIVYWAPPWWVRGFVEAGPEVLPGRPREGGLFRDHHPLRIGVGCKKRCTYCTINATRDAAYELDLNSHLVAEFKAHSPAVVIADSPTVRQVDEWALVALATGKRISFRNVEPTVANACFGRLHDLARNGLLDVLHVPIQSLDPAVLRDMGRPVEETLRFVDSVRPELRVLKTLLATNVIVLYKGFPDDWYPEVKRLFDYVSWNPFWDGVWDRARAEARWRLLIDGDYEPGHAP